jgi:SsrA-binding protein
VSEPERKSICRNRKARFAYHLEETIEAGMELLGSEVKSLREGRANLVDAYAAIRDGEAYLLKAHIAPYEQANRENHEPTRERRLLLHRQQLRRLSVKLREQGYTLVPLERYFSKGRAKVELALARGKKLHDKRRAVAKRESDRQLRRVTKRRLQDR